MALMHFMVNQNDPTDRNDWNSIRRECALAHGLISVGIFTLNSASYKNGEGYYYSAFFNLSIGIERMAKLILVADYIIENNGKLPNKQIIKKYGHDLIKLLEKVETIAKKYKITLKHERPRDNISTAIISCLDSFANAQKGRYANFNTLGDPNFEPALEPIKKWWEEVAESILDAHYYNKTAEQDVKSQEISNPENMHQNDTLFYTDETGNIINTLQGFIERDKKTEIVQKYGCYYTLRIVRWMTEIFCKFSTDKRYEALHGHSESFIGFILSDEDIKSTWQCQ